MTIWLHAYEIYILIGTYNKKISLKLFTSLLHYFFSLEFQYESTKYEIIKIIIQIKIK